MALILDTGPLLAALDAGDADHERSAALISETDEALVVPGLVLAELDYWCHKRLGLDAWVSFLEDLLAGAFELEWPIRADLERCRDLEIEYADLGIGVVDASIVALVERREEKKLATLDRRHFGTVRAVHGAPLTLLP